MSGIYIHIPFCKQACHYCDFHFSTSVKNKPAMVEAICREIVLRKPENIGKVETIYFGGGTPSLLSPGELERVMDTIFQNFPVTENAEITLEANPDDLTETKLAELGASPINRLSIGVQSFFEKDLRLMNRAHDEKEALEAVKLARKYFQNISIDLIYGIPGLSMEDWMANLTTAVELGVPHISSYALTVEPRTALKKMIEKGRIPPVEEDLAKAHYEIMTETLGEAGFDNYEFSNFGKPGYFSRNNTAYWFGEPYLGIGPSAHSFDTNVRKWNVSNNNRYIQSLQQEVLPFELEQLSTSDRYNEYVMTRLRTKWGISLSEVYQQFGSRFHQYLLKEAESLFKKGLLEIQDDFVRVSKKGKFLSDGISSELFFIDLDE